MTLNRLRQKIAATAGNLGSPNTIRLIGLGAFLSVIQGCSTIDPPPQTDCQRFTEELHNIIGEYSHFDPAIPLETQTPYLRSDRFLASFSRESLSLDQRRQLQSEQTALAIQKYLEELQRVPNLKKAKLAALSVTDSITSSIEKCATEYVSTYKTPQVTTVKPSYSRLNRWLGIYPISKLFASKGIAEYQRTMRQRVELGLAKPNPYANLKAHTYQLRGNNAVQSLSQPVLNTHNPLGIPKPTEDQLNELLSLYAPKIKAYYQSDDDKLGAMFYRESGELGVNLEHPKVYSAISYTRFDGDVLLQLNYHFWFPRRSGDNIYAGALDGVTWRVTLDHQSRPLIFDTIHQCGCYHLVFTMPSISDLKRPSTSEKPIIFELNDLPNQGSPYQGSWEIGIEPGNHYVTQVTQSVTNSGDERTIPYDIEAYAQMLALASPTRVESVFSSSGIIKQSERGERWLLWPLGVPNAGAMRQAGLQATAFIGQRHFDDAFLFEEIGLGYRKTAGADGK